jgi:hypothetical protein
MAPLGFGRFHTAKESAVQIFCNMFGVTLPRSR